MGRIQPGCRSALTGRDLHQMPALQGVQGFLHRCPAHLQFTGERGLLNPLTRTNLPGHDPFCKVIGNLLGQCVRHLKIHKGSLDRS